MTTKVMDDLLGLFSICEGTVSIKLNPQAVGEQSIIEWLSDYRGTRIIPTAQKVEMIEAGKVVHISYCLDRFCSTIDVFGGSVKQAAFRAFALAKQVLGKEDFTFEFQEYNSTDFLEQFEDAFSNEITINLNEHEALKRDSCVNHLEFRTVKDWIKFQSEFYEYARNSVENG